MKKACSIIFLVLFSLKNSFACLNGDTRELNDGTVISLDEKGSTIPHGHEFLYIDFLKKLKELDSLWKATGDIDYLSDYGMVLILNKEYKKAKDVYLRIEEIKPARYSTASNLGTVYELLGDNENALIWINKAIKIDPDSHKGSEWLHAKILEAKIKGEQYITSDFLINTNFGKDPNPRSDLSAAELLQLRNALYYQLNERVSFIPPTDNIVAQLLFELANICALTNENPAAVTVYNKAKEYGFSDPVLQMRIASAQGLKPQKQQAVDVKQNEGNYMVWVIAGLSILIVFVTIRFLRKKPSAGVEIAANGSDPTQPVQ